MLIVRYITFEKIEIVIAIITADIINSRKITSEKWLETLQSILDKYGKNPLNWEIYRGDSFQLEIPVVKALEAAFRIKSTIKQFKLLDVRMAIGIGEVNYRSDNIMTSNGSAFIHSGECFGNLEKRTLGIKTPWEKFNHKMNVMLQLACLTADKWSVISSKTVAYHLVHPLVSQRKAALAFKKSQGRVSESLQRAGFKEIKQLIDYYAEEIQTLC